MVTFAIALGLLALGFLHRVLSRQRSAWPGAIVPAALLVAVGWFVAEGLLDTGLEWALVAVALVAMLRIWDEGRQHRATHAGPA